MVKIVRYSAGMTSKIFGFVESKKMDSQNIQEQLNTELAKDEVRIIFWFDDKEDYSKRGNATGKQESIKN